MRLKKLGKMQFGEVRKESSWGMSSNCLCCRLDELLTKIDSAHSDHAQHKDEVTPARAFLIYRLMRTKEQEMALSTAETLFVTSQGRKKENLFQKFWERYWNSICDEIKRYPVEIDGARMTAQYHELKEKVDNVIRIRVPCGHYFLDTIEIYACKNCFQGAIATISAGEVRLHYDNLPKEIMQAFGDFER